MSEPDIAALHRRALDRTRLVVSGIGPDQLDLPTPDQEWDVRALLNHVVAGNLWAAELAAGVAKAAPQRLELGDLQAAVLSEDGGTGGGQPGPHLLDHGHLLGPRLADAARPFGHARVAHSRTPCVRSVLPALRRSGGSLRSLKVSTSFRSSRAADAPVEADPASSGGRIPLTAPGGGPEVCGWVGLLRKVESSS